MPAQPSLRRTIVQRLLVSLACVALCSSSATVAQGEAAEGKQSVLGPGMYVFQTRVRNSTCGDAQPDGYVLTYLATIDGVPGSITMTMQLVNTAHFKEWALKVSGKEVVGDSRMGSAADAPDSHFEVRWDKDRFKGVGSRSYNGQLNGKPERCRVNYDALLRRLDDR
jgi:hypothetical protein